MVSEEVGLEELGEDLSESTRKRRAWVRDRATARRASSEITRETKQAREGRAGEREKDKTSEAATATETATETWTSLVMHRISSHIFVTSQLCNFM